MPTLACYSKPSFSQHSCGMLMHAVADATWHISQCLRWLAIDKLIGQGTLSLGVVSMHSTASKISDPPGDWSGLLRLVVPLAIAFCNAWVFVLCGPISGLRWLAIDKTSFLTAKLWHADACGCCCNLAHFIVPTLACYRQAQLSHSIAVAC